ncbi:MAG: hypothetical protein ACYS0E_13525 [Planctomycetota bacterium]|jgi:hypothetical protein
MHRFNKVSIGRRLGIASLALLLSASLTWAATMEEDIAGNCDVTVVVSGEATIEFGAKDDEDWVDFSIGLDAEGMVSVDGMPVGMIDMRDTMRFEISLTDGVASITVTDDVTGELLWMHDVEYETVAWVSADGAVDSLDVD